MTQSSTMNRLGYYRLVVAIVCLPALVGCQALNMSVSTPKVWPFVTHEKTTYRTPSMRIDAIGQIGTSADGTDSPQQNELTDQLARQIQIEPDSLVRVAIVDAIGEFSTPLSSQVLQAALQDESNSVRIASCEELGVRGEAQAVTSLSNILKNDDDIDVRLAAAEALGQIKSNESILALITALDDRDPALQYTGVEAMRSITGQDLGGDVETWRQMAANLTPASSADTPSLANRARDLSPF